jgi:hypothetical protein
MSARFAAFLAWILGHRRSAALLSTAHRRAAWDSIEVTLADLRRAA